jgi:hypothetical protein
MAGWQALDAPYIGGGPSGTVAAMAQNMNAF